MLSHDSYPPERDISEPRRPQAALLCADIPFEGAPLHESQRDAVLTGDGLSAYLVYEPRVGKTDGDRNMMSNIHPRGTAPEHAATRLGQVARAMLDQGCSGVHLDLSRFSEFQTGYREAQERRRLVERHS